MIPTCEVCKKMVNGILPGFTADDGGYYHYQCFEKVQKELWEQKPRKDCLFCNRFPNCSILQFLYKYVFSGKIKSGKELLKLAKIEEIPKYTFTMNRRGMFCSLYKSKTQEWFVTNLGQFYTIDPATRVLEFKTGSIIFNCQLEDGKTVEVKFPPIESDTAILSGSNKAEADTVFGKMTVTIEG